MDQKNSDEVNAGPSASQDAISADEKERGYAAIRAIDGYLKPELNSIYLKRPDLREKFRELPLHGIRWQMWSMIDHIVSASHTESMLHEPLIAAVNDYFARQDAWLSAHENDEEHQDLYVLIKHDRKSTWKYLRWDKWEWTEEKRLESDNERLTSIREIIQ